MPGGHSFTGCCPTVEPLIHTKIGKGWNRTSDRRLDPLARLGRPLPLSYLPKDGRGWNRTNAAGFPLASNCSARPQAAGWGIETHITGSAHLHSQMPLVIRSPRMPPRFLNQVVRPQGLSIKRPTYTALLFYYGHRPVWESNPQPPSCSGRDAIPFDQPSMDRTLLLLFEAVKP